MIPEVAMDAGASTLPCPFCGGEAVNFLGIDRFLWIANCLQCGALGPSGRDIQAARAAWNQRCLQGASYR